MTTSSASRAERTATRAPQQDRSRATRLHLLEAAVECLADVGWSGSTMAVVAQRADVSRGALQHHFPTREDLFMAAVQHVVEVRSTELRRQLAAHRADDTTTTAVVVDAIFAMHTGPAFKAALELWVASTADPALRAQVISLEARIGREIHVATVDLLAVDEREPGTREMIQATLDLARGLGLANLLTDDSRRRRGIAERWAATLDREIGIKGNRQH